MNKTITISSSDKSTDIITRDGINSLLIDIQTIVNNFLLKKGITDTISFNLVGKEDTSVINVKNSLADFTTDENHRFITDAQLNSMDSFCSETKCAEEIKTAEISFNRSINELFNKLLNNSASLDKVKMIIDLCEKTEFDDIFESLMQYIDIKLSEHDTNTYHISAEDRENLIALKNFLAIGCSADWNADVNSPDFIRNKPESLPANGGNADTVGGCTVKEIRNKQLDSIIIGPKGDTHSTLQFITGDLSELINNIDAGGSISLKAGCYSGENIEMNLIDREYSNGIYVHGTGNASQISFDKIYIGNNTKIRDVAFFDSDIIIGSDCDIESVIFSHCSVCVDNATCTRVSKNKFVNGSTITYNRTNGCIITENISDGTVNFKKSYSASSIISNNI